MKRSLNPSRPATNDDLRRLLNRQFWQVTAFFALSLLTVAVVTGGALFGAAYG